MTPLHSTHPREAALVEYHNLYCNLSGRDERYGFYLREWQEFSKHFTKDDLVLVFKHIARENQRRQKQYHIRTALLEIIGDLSHFESLRADAAVYEKAIAARARKVQPSEGQRQLAAARGEPEPVVEQAEKRISMDLVIQAMRSETK